MELKEAEKLMELQSCITHFLDLFLSEVEELSSPEAKRVLSAGIKEVIGVNLTEVIMPIIGKYAELNPYTGAESVSAWFKNSKLKYISSVEHKKA